jgi:hypothetical protein
MIEVKATKQNTDREVAALIDLGENIEDAIAKFGAEVVFTNFQSQAKIRAQAIMRDMLTEGKTDEEIADFMATWKPGSTRERNIDPTAAFLKKFDTMDEDAKNKMIEDLMAKAGKA